MVQKDKADLKLRCIYPALEILRKAESSAVVQDGKGQNPTTQQVVEEAKVIYRWVSGEKGNDK